MQSHVARWPDPPYNQSVGLAAKRGKRDVRHPRRRVSCMPGPVVWKIAAPMVGLGVFLLGLGVFAAWKVHEQQRVTSGLIAREVHGIIAATDLHMSMRELRYQLNLFLRTRDRQHLEKATALEEEIGTRLARAREVIDDASEKNLLEQVDGGYKRFLAEFREIIGHFPAPTSVDAARVPLAASPEHLAALTILSDVLITHDILEPIHAMLEVNQQVVARTNEASEVAAQHLVVGFLLLGISGGAAGLLMGTAISRAIGKSIVQLIVSVRGVAGRLSDVSGPVTFSHVGDLSGIESSLLAMEKDIAAVVERLQRSESERLRNEQLAHVGQLAAGMAHELRNPLMPMKMLVQSAIERRDDEGLRGRSLEVVNGEIVRLEGAIQMFLDFARPPALVKTRSDVRQIIASALDLLSARAERQSVVIDWTSHGEPAIALVDAVQIRQLLLNMLLNAIDALPDGGHVSVSVEKDGDGTKADEGWLTVRIRDTGSGIPAHILPVVFDPFVTTKESGTGLGLPISARIAEAHGGSLTVSNLSSGGAEFTVRLPCGEEI